MNADCLTNRKLTNYDIFAQKTAYYLYGLFSPVGKEVCLHRAVSSSSIFLFFQLQEATPLLLL